MGKRKHGGQGGNGKRVRINYISMCLEAFWN